jgi:hypothetical protein
MDAAAISAARRCAVICSAGADRAPELLADDADRHVGAIDG